MNKQGLLSNLKHVHAFQRIIFIYLVVFPLVLHASFIESTIGTAVVNDATATYYNPAALILLKNNQMVTLGSIAYFHSHFTGQVTQAATGFTQSGSSNAHTHYYLPSLYFGVPTHYKIALGLAVISNSFNRDMENNSILRYTQSNNSIQNIDVVPAIGIRLNEFFSIGAGINISYANFLLKPILGFPSLNIPDSQSRNESSGTGWGGDVGFLLKTSVSTLIGFNYRSSVTYQLEGKSVFESQPKVTSNHYHFKFWTPARSVLSINHFITKTLGLIGTLQYIQWNIFKDINIHGIATQIGSQPVIIPSAKVHYHLHNTWLITLGGHYRITPTCVIRIAGSYDGAPASGNYQISNGDNIIIGASIGYEISKIITLDGSYAHAFIRDKRIHVTGRNLINGINKGSRDALSLKLTINV